MVAGGRKGGGGGGGGGGDASRKEDERRILFLSRDNRYLFIIVVTVVGARFIGSCVPATQYRLTTVHGREIGSFSVCMCACVCVCLSVSLSLLPLFSSFLANRPIFDDNIRRHAKMSLAFAIARMTNAI